MYCDFKSTRLFLPVSLSYRSTTPGYQSSPGHSTFTRAPTNASGASNDTSALGLAYVGIGPMVLYNDNAVDSGSGSVAITVAVVVAILIPLLPLLPLLLLLLLLL